jgi:hypothetical protein
MTRSIFALALLVLAAGMAAAQTPSPSPAPAQTPAPSINDAAKEMVGSWEFSTADRDRICTITFKSDRTAVGFKVEFDGKCAELFPLVKDVAGWKYPDNDLLSLLDAKGKALVEFSEVENGIFEAPTPGLGVLFLQNAADAGAPPRPPEQIAGDWAIMRASGKPLCTLTLTLNAAGDGFALNVKPGCDPAIARLNFNLWRMDRGELMLSPARGNPWRFEASDANNWLRVPESANPYTLVRQ